MGSLEDLSPAFIARNAESLKAQGVEIPAHLLPRKPKDPVKEAAKLERKLQADIEGWLRMHGYYRRSPTDIAILQKAPKGWQIHVHKAKKNPILLDIILLGNDGRYLEFEIKRAPIRYSSEEQKILCEQYGVPVVTSIDGAMELVKKWES